jgi:hypothetical protein
MLPTIVNGQPNRNSSSINVRAEQFKISLTKNSTQRCFVVNQNMGWQDVKNSSSFGKWVDDLWNLYPFIPKSPTSPTHAGF